MRSHPVLACLVLAVAVGACSSSGDYLIVTVDARPAVHDARSLKVTLTNAGTSRSDTLVLRDQAFPVTFSISAPGRAGDLAVTVEALGDGDLVVGRGDAVTKVEAAAAQVMLDSTDFVVNTDYAGDQFPSDDFEATGFQLAASTDGTWTVGFRDSCMQSACNVFARRFGPTGVPVVTQAAAGTNAFVVTARPSDIFTEPALASSEAATVALWNFTDPQTPTTTGVACRTITAAGGLGADQTTLSDDTIAEAVAVAALPGGGFAASWNAIPAGTTLNVIRAAFLGPDCSVVKPAATVSNDTAFVDRNAVATSGDRVLFTWVSGGDLHSRMASSTGELATADTVLIAKTATDQVAHARIAAAPGGEFLLAVRWIQTMGSSAPGKIELYRVSAAGALVGAPTLVSDQSGGTIVNDEAFGLASGPAGTAMVAWHTCAGSGEVCTLSGRILNATGQPLTDSFAIPTTQGGSAKRPSVIGLPDAFAVVWADSSGKPPDTAGQSVRARLIYPPAGPGR